MPGAGLLHVLCEDQEDLGGLLPLARQAMSLGVLWSVQRPGLLLRLAGEASAGGARLYLIGPPDLGHDISERRWLKQHARRLLARRGVACAADLLLINTGEEKLAVLLLYHSGRGYWLRLSVAQAAAAAEWFAHLFWHHATEEGLAGPTGYRFHRCGAAPFPIPALPPEAPLWLVHGPLPRPLEGCSESPGGGHLDAPAQGPGQWSLRLNLDPAQAATLAHARRG